MTFGKVELRQIQLWVLGAQLLVFVAGFGVWTWFDFDEIEQQASEEVEAAGVLLEEHVLRSLAAIDSALLQTADLVNDIGVTEMRSEAAWQRLRSIARPLPLSGAIFIYDLNGDTIAASSSYPAPVGNRADREYFQYLLAGKADQYIGKALQGRTVHNLFFPVARSIRATDGRLEAVAQVGVEVDYIADLFTKAELQGKAFALYRLSDGALVARHPVTARLLDETISSQGFFAALSDGSPQWAGWVNADGNRLLLSARRVSELPLILTASMPQASVFDHAYEQLRRRGLALLVATGALMTLGVMLLRSAKREARIAAQQRRAEKELRQKNVELAEAQRVAHIGSWFWDAQTDATTGSDELLRIYGFDPATQSMPDFREQRGQCYPIGDWERVNAAVQTTMATGVGYELDVHAFRNGSPVWITTRGEVVRGAGGRVVALRGTVQDITHRKAAEEALRESEERLRLLGDNLPDSALYQYAREPDGSSRFLYISAGIERLNGVRVQDVLRDPGTLHRQIPPEYLTPILEKEAQAHRDLSDFDAEVPMRRPDGEVRWMRLHSRPRRMPDGRTILDGVQTDITERKRAEEQLQRLNENLENAVRERTAELFAANRELEERAQKLRRLAGELTMTEQRERKQLAKILHDGLQQYLVAAKLQVGGLVQQVHDDETRQSALSVESLLGESITVSRSLAAELSPPILHEAGILAGMEWLARWMANTHGLHVDLVVEMEPPILSEDVKVLLFESVRELLLNVVKHAKADAARVHLSQDDARHLRITVSDRGKGFDAAAASHGRDGGGGFGLFSIRERIGLVDGRFEMVSSPGEGSRVALIAPFAPRGPVEPASTAPRTGMRADAPGPPRQTGKIRILLTDDHTVMREGLARLLAQEPDFEVVGQANNGKQAIEKAGALLPDLILMDISMPEMDGIEAARIIRRHHPGIAIIGLSLYSEAERGKEMLEAGATVYLSKSGPPADLKAAIRACWRARSDMRAEAAPSSKN